MRRGRGRAVFALLLLPILAGSAALCAEPRKWVSSPASLMRGESEGTAVSSAGELFAAPRLDPQGERGDEVFPTRVWATATDRVGNIFLGTGAEGQILKLSSGGDRSVFFRVAEVMVTALALTGDGSLLAGAAPGGKIYRIGPSGEGRVWCDTGERYVWSIVEGRDGRIYAATGESGLLLEIDSSGKPRTLFDSNESHLVSLVALPQGGWLAGGAPRGLVYRIDDEGNGLVLYDDGLEEVRALDLDDQGRVVAALLGGRQRPEKRPAVRLRLPGGSGARVDTVVGDFEETRKPEVRGVIEGLPEAADKAAKARTVGRVVRIDPEGRAEELWHSEEAAPFSLLRDGDGWVFGTGEPARLWRIDGADRVSRLATLREGQLTELVRVGRSIFLATSNALATYRVDQDRRESGVFHSELLDAGGPARWGSVGWRQEGQEGRVEVYTRTGNSRPPDDTWSGWSPAMVDPRRNRIDNPDGRFLQWRVRFAGTHSGGLRLSNFTITYEPYNRPPELRDVKFSSREPVFSADATMNWTASDPDRDPVRVTLEYRPAGGGEWTAAPDKRGDGAAESRRKAGRQGLQHGKLVWDTTVLDEGAYDVRAIADDQSANPPGQAGRAVLDALPPVIVDRTPPSIEVRTTAAGGTELTVEDTHSPLSSVHLVRDEQPRYRLRPEDGVCDSVREVFVLETLPAGDDWLARARDAAGNIAVVTLKPK